MSFTTQFEQEPVDALSRMGWNKQRTLERSGHNPANHVEFQNAIVLKIIADQGGTADDTNVRAAFGNATPEACIATIAAL